MGMKPDRQATSSGQRAAVRIPYSPTKPSVVRAYRAYAIRS